MVTKNKSNKPNHNKESLSSQQTIDSNTLPITKKSRKGSLGSIAKFASHAQQNNKNKRDEATIKRFKLQKVAAKLLSTKRVSNCQRLLVPNAQNVEVHYQPDGHSAHYKNLRTCDSVWDCPVCSAKITEQRRVELQKAVVEATNHDITPVLVTFTLQHDRGDKLVDLLDALKTAYRKFKSGRAWQALKDEYGVYGSITSTEVTNGHGREKNNGWHPHLHALVFILPHSHQSLARMEAQFKARWSYVLQQLGYDASWSHGLTIKSTDAQVAQYIAKFGKEPKGKTWTVDRELTKAPVKLANDDGVTPFGLLELFEAGDEKAGELFKEYSKVFHGRAQLVWSRGLRKLLKVGEEKTDEELNAVEDEQAELLTSVTRYTWYRLTQLAKDVRGELLCIAANGDADKFQKRVFELVGADEYSPPPKSKGKKPMSYPCPHCGAQAHYLRVVIDADQQAAAEFWCRECAVSLYTYDLTSAQVVDAEIAHEAQSEKRQPPAREVAVEEQLRLKMDEPRVWY